VLARKREWSHDVLNFLPVYIDDLYARQALIHGGIALVDEFRYQLLKGRGVEHAREQLVPPAFAEAIDDAIALDLFAAAVAPRRGQRPTRDGRREGRHQRGGGRARARRATRPLRLFEDDDVLDLFQMSEPADAAMAGHDPIKRHLGVVDQRIDAWFRPFGGVTLTGYRHETKDGPGT
jgi:hypothetical protein